MIFVKIDFMSDLNLMRRPFRNFKYMTESVWLDLVISFSLIWTQNSRACKSQNMHPRPKIFWNRISIIDSDTISKKEVILRPSLGQERLHNSLHVIRMMRKSYQVIWNYISSSLDNFWAIFYYRHENWEFSKKPFAFRALNEHSDSCKMLPTYIGNFCMIRNFDLEL